MSYRAVAYHPNITIVAGSWLRSNDRSTTVVLTLHSLSSEKKEVWWRALQGPQSNAQVELYLLHEDQSDATFYTSTFSKPKVGPNGEIRAARFENFCVAPLMANATKLSEERIQLPKPRMTFQLKNGAPEVSLKECDTDHKALKDYMKISETSDGVSITIRFSTNMTSKCHAHQKFQFVSRVSTTSNGIDQVLKTSTANLLLSSF